MHDEEKVRIVVKKSSHGGGHHGGAWKVAYADFVTTMMALFIVLWIVGQKPDVKEAIAQYFRDPGVHQSSPAPSLAPGGAGLLPGQPERSDSVVEVDTGEDRAAEERKLRAAAERIEELTRPGGTFESLREQIRIELTPEGLRIELMERDGTPFFRVGSAVLIAPLRPILEKLEPILGELSNHITLEGHTDSRQYHIARDYSNWELSTDRAHSARRVLEGSGLPADRVDRVVGHADRLLLTPGDPLDAKNRRITILVRRHDHEAIAETRHGAPALRAPHAEHTPEGAPPHS
jgi:chemotaxis protein MotB